MKGPLSIALASLFIAALVAPSAQAATRRYDFQEESLGQGGVRIALVVFYKNKQRHGRYTPRQAIYESSVPISCNPPVAQAYAYTSSLIRGTPDFNYIKLRKGSFTYSDTYSDSSSAISASATGKVIKKKPRVNKQLRVDGSVSILDYNLPPDYHNCTSGGPVPYSATPCRQTNPDLPYIKKSLPSCSRG
ncbi:MAG: hypothetical protein WB462_09470 [Solirubrobacterales bacterium]|jgi:hypothetical protein